MKKNKKMHKIKSKNNKSKDAQRKEKRLSNDRFSFDDEIVIGVTKRPSEDKKINNKNKGNAKNNKESKRVSSTTKKKNNKKQLQNKNKKNTKTEKTYKEENYDIKREENIRKRKKKLKIIKYFSIITLFVIVVLITMFSPLFNIKTITITGNNIVSENEIISLSQIQIEENTYKVSSSRTSKNIKQNAYIESVNIKRKLPSEIIIQVKEREPIFTIEYGPSYIYIDKQGYMLDIVNENPSLPILQGIETESEKYKVGNRLDIEDLKKLGIVLQIMESATSNEIGDLITRIDISNDKNYTLIFETKEKTAYLGDASNLSTRILKLKKILENEEGNAGEIFIDMDLNTSNPIFRQRV